MTLYSYFPPAQAPRIVAHLSQLHRQPQARSPTAKNNL